ncbi:MAG: retroviral-like aspartic protease family protein [Thermoplasmata archaeon]|nr:retroviral-like aspartic protease family protein [Thermoplasmata archaeon]
MKVHLSCRRPHFWDYITFLVDTGASKTCISQMDAEILGISYRSLKEVEPENRPIGVGGPVPAYYLRNIILRCKADNKLFSTTLREIYVLKDTPKETMSLLGTDFMDDNDFSLFFSPKKDKAYFER